MRLSELFGGTHRERPAEATAPSHELLLRGGYVRPLAAGIYTCLPLAVRALRKIESVVREEMDAIGGQEILMPVVQPAEIWEESGRYATVGPELVRLHDRAGRPMVLAMTHEEVVTDLARGEIRSYRQLPRMLYQIQTKFRDEPRARGGLIRAREFTMKDAYSFHADREDLDRYYPHVCRAYSRIFDRCGLPTVTVASDTGMMGGTAAHEFMALAEVGEDTILRCSACGAAANRQVARFRRPEPAAEEPAELRRTPTPGCTTIDQVAACLGVPPSRTAKAVFFSATVGGKERLVLALTRGDMSVNVTKLQNHVGTSDLAPAPAAAIRDAGAVPGYASPIGIRDCVVVVDELIARSPNLVCGANEEGFHFVNSNFGRDYNSEHVIDLAAAEEGFACASCGESLGAHPAIEVGNTFKLGTRYSEVMKASYLDELGRALPIFMGCYGIGVGRTLAAVVEHAHDDDGILWPVSIAPYPVHLVVLRPDTGGIPETARRLVADLEGAGLEILVDDRDEMAGVKFKDADLLGMPVRLTLSPRSLAKGVVEVRMRSTGDRTEVAAPDLVRAVRARLEGMDAALRAVADARTLPPSA